MMRPMNVRMKEFSWIYLNLLEFAWIYLNLFEFTWIRCFEKNTLRTDGPTDGRTDGQSLRGRI